MATRAGNLARGICRYNTMHWILLFRQFFHDLIPHLNAFAAVHPIGVYGLLALIIFCETGLVVTPFLPGDSLLFAVGAVVHFPGSPVHLPLIVVLLCLAANCGDMLNYTLGYHIGPRIFSRQKSFLLNRRHLDEAQAFYQRHGRMTIIIARFVPIIRTFAPFVAGIGKMNFFRFAAFSISGGFLWVILLTLAGYFFGGMPLVRDHIELVVPAIVLISVAPMAIHYLKSRGASPVVEADNVAR
jgi:membrane-associated protein